MEWLTANWFWILIGILFIGMHLVGHGGYGGHGGDDRQPRNDARESDEALAPGENTGSGRHQH